MWHIRKSDWPKKSFIWQQWQSKWSKNRPLKETFLQLFFLESKKEKRKEKHLSIIRFTFKKFSNYLFWIRLHDEMFSLLSFVQWWGWWLHKKMYTAVVEVRVAAETFSFSSFDRLSLTFLPRQQEASKKTHVKVFNKPQHENKKREWDKKEFFSSFWTS